MEGERSARAAFALKRRNGALTGGTPSYDSLLCVKRQECPIEQHWPAQDENYKRGATVLRIHLNELRTQQRLGVNISTWLPFFGGRLQ
jgi:hypothetical protein